MSFWVPNRIVLLSNGRHDEAVAASDCYPGMLLAGDSSGQVLPHNVAGGGVPSRGLMVAKEDALQGFTIKQLLPSTFVIPFHRPVSGDRLLMLLQTGQNVAKGDPLMSAGDGTLIKNLGQVLSSIVAASTALSTSASEQTFSNGTYAIPANFLKVGDVLRIKGRATVTGQNGSDTNRLKVYLGTSVLMDTAAVNVAANGILDFNVTLTVRTVGASGTFITTGFFSAGAIGTGAEKEYSLESTAVDTTAAQTVAVKNTQSASSSSNTTVLNEFQINLDRDGGLETVVIAAEAFDNSGGTGTSPFNNAAFLPCLVA